MVRTNPIPEGLRGRPFSEQAEALPAREALRAVLSEAPGFRDETPDPVTFTVQYGVAAEPCPDTWCAM